MKDRRGSITIDVSLLKNFLHNHYSVYSRDMVIINGLEHPIMFSVSMNQNFIVSLGADMLYSGTDIAEAIRIFNLDVGGIKKLWNNLDSEKRNVVSHPRAKIEKE